MFLLNKPLSWSCLQKRRKSHQPMRGRGVSSASAHSAKTEPRPPPYPSSSVSCIFPLAAAEAERHTIGRTKLLVW